jgi:hypothetical protein
MQIQPVFIAKKSYREENLKCRTNNVTLEQVAELLGVEFTPTRRSRKRSGDS